MTSRPSKHSPFSLILAVIRFILKHFKSIFHRLFPIGYEDDTGFHHGKE